MDKQDLIAPLTAPTSPLGSLLAAYFNYDWDEDYESWQKVVAVFARDSKPGEADVAVSEIDRLLANEATEEDLGWILKDGLHSGFVPSRNGMGNREAFQAIRDELRRQAEARSGGQP